jgi:glyoxylase I family protein
MDRAGTLQAFHHVALSVSDRDAAAEWYARVLGFEELFREDGDDRRACVMRFADGGYSVGLVEHGRGGGPFDATRSGLDHVAFAVGSRSELLAWAERLAAAGVTHAGVADIPPGAILNFRDGDGIALALFWDREDRRPRGRR